MFLFYGLFHLLSLLAQFCLTSHCIVLLHDYTGGFTRIQSNAEECYGSISVWCRWVQDAWQIDGKYVRNESQWMSETETGKTERKKGEKEPRNSRRRQSFHSNIVAPLIHSAKLCSISSSRGRRHRRLRSHHHRGHHRRGKEP